MHSDHLLDSLCFIHPHLYRVHPVNYLRHSLLGPVILHCYTTARSNIDCRVVSCLDSRDESSQVCPGISLSDGTWDSAGRKLGEWGHDKDAAV